MYNIGAGKILWYDIRRMNLENDEVDEYELKTGDLLVNRVLNVFNQTPLIEESH